MKKTHLMDSILIGTGTSKVSVRVGSYDAIHCPLIEHTSVLHKFWAGMMVGMMDVSCNFFWWLQIVLIYLTGTVHISKHLL